MMRNIYDVINEMLLEIPKTEQGIIKALKKLQDSVCYTAPEVMIYRWGSGADILYTYFGDNPKEEWQQKVVKIWMEKE